MKPIGTWSGGAGEGRDERVASAPQLDERLSEQDRLAFTDDHNEFACELYQRLSQGTGNRIVSPLSIRATMAMAWAGARGDTAEQMKAALHFGSPDGLVHAGFGALVRRLLKQRASDEGMTMANSLWVQAGSPLRPEFVECIDRFHGGVANVVDFRQDAEAARRRINEWVESETQARIRELMGPHSVDAATRLVLANACHFLGKWVKPFPAEKTNQLPFHLQDGSQVEAPLMHLSLTCRSVHRADFQAVELEYRHCGLSMLVLLPRAKDGLPALEGRLSAGLLRECVAPTYPLEVRVWLPRFRMKWSGDVGATLQALGMSAAFDAGRADFSGINGCRPPQEDSLSVSQVRHEAWIETDEQGTRAAAATGGSMTKCLPMEFRADHPFLFVIRDLKYGVICFLGRVADPTRES